MPQPPPINPAVNDIADRAKHGYALGTRLLASVQYRLATLALTGRLEPDESMRLQHVLADIWSALYLGTTYAVRDEDTDDDTWDEADNTYSDGRTVMVQTRIEPWEDSDFSCKHNRFLCGDGAVNEHPRGTICHISPRQPTDEHGVADASPKDPPGEFACLRPSAAPSHQPATDWAERALAEAQRLEDDDDGTP
jgi:hypothetical protein